MNFAIAAHWDGFLPTTTRNKDYQSPIPLRVHYYQHGVLSGKNIMDEVVPFYIMLQVKPYISQIISLIIYASLVLCTFK